MYYEINNKFCAPNTTQHACVTAPRKSTSISLCLRPCDIIKMLLKHFFPLTVKKRNTYSYPCILNINAIVFPFNSIYAIVNDKYWAIRVYLQEFEDGQKDRRADKLNAKTQKMLRKANRFGILKLINLVKGNSIKFKAGVKS